MINSSKTKVWRKISKRFQISRDHSRNYAWGVDEVKCSKKLGRFINRFINRSLSKIYQKSRTFIIFENLPNAIEQTVVLVGQVFQSITYQCRHNLLTSPLRNPWKSPFILNEESDSLVGKKQVVWPKTAFLK